MENKQTTGYWTKNPASEINKAISELPTAELHELKDAVTGDIIVNRYATVVDGEYIDFPSHKYVLKQHAETFRPVIEAITLRGVADFEFSLWSTHARASLAIYVGEAEDGVKFGFKVTNSLDRSTSIRYSMNAYKKETSVQIVEKEHVLVWGYRQTCSNGMVVKIPLRTCKYLDAVELTKIKKLLSTQSRIIHMGKSVDNKLERVQFLVEGFLLLKDPLNRMIIDAQSFELDMTTAKRFLLRYIGKRRLDKYLELYGREEQTLWGLYNSITFLASHGAKLTSRTRERLLVGASDMLTAELITA